MAETRFNAIIGMDSESSIRVVSAIAVKNNNGTMDWKFTCKIMTIIDVTNSLRSREKWLNVGLASNSGAKNGIVGTSGSLSRFKDRPVVIISQIVAESGRLIGYKVADYKGRVRNISLREMLAYGEKATKEGKVPVQNAIFNAGTDDRKGFYKSYTGAQFITEVFTNGTKKPNTNTESSTKINTSQNEESLKRLDEIFSKEQINQLKLAREHGVDVRKIANPRLSYAQMREQRVAWEKGVNPTPYSSPEYEPMVMRFYTAELKNGRDIRGYLSPKYSLGQLSELSLAEEDGLDLSLIADVKKTPQDMAEIRERMIANIWKDELVKKDGSWI